tara:strand:+ start:1249 stop:2085 length:837 start_codon:yes stop_codon:yes gene_type:complete
MKNNDILEEILKNKKSLYNEIKIRFEESKFGIDMVSPFLNKLKPSSNILEIGSGPCLLLSKITEKYPKLNINGIEPIGEGFELFDTILKILKKKQKKINLFRGKFEDYNEKKIFDLIFSVNVLEHVENWERYFDFLKKFLSKNGIALIYCPNYGFPYDCHFRIPMLINKKLTFKLFKNKIEEIEKKNNWVGLWKSINCVNYKQIKQYCNNIDLNVVSHPEINTILLERLDVDEEFRKRQNVFRLPGKLLRKTRILKIIYKIEWFHKYLPFMFLEIRKF